MLTNSVSSKRRGKLLAYSSEFFNSSALCWLSLYPHFPEVCLTEQKPDGFVRPRLLRPAG